VSATRFRALSLITLGGLYAVVVTGATVRLTASGLGCENWPRCGKTPFPTQAQGGHSVIEFSNRLVAGLVVAMTLLLWLNARRAHLPTWLRRLTLALFIGTFAQIPLGGILTLANLNPFLVMWHFLLAIAALAAGVVMAFESLGLPRAPRLPRPLPELAALLAAAGATLFVTGAFATASGPHPGSLSEIRRIYTVEGTVYVHVRATAVFGITLALILGVLLVRARRVVRAALPLLVLLGVQMAVGEIQYRRGLPWWLVLIHVGLAAAVWVATVAFVTCLWKPPFGLAARVNSQDAGRTAHLPPTAAPAAGPDRRV
jgi:cytochrome c oxidase assembly protein subunit 15